MLLGSARCSRSLLDARENIPVVRPIMLIVVSQFGVDPPFQLSTIAILLDVSSFVSPGGTLSSFVCFLLSMLVQVSHVGCQYSCRLSWSLPLEW